MRLGLTHKIITKSSLGSQTQLDRLLPESTNPRALTVDKHRRISHASTNAAVCLFFPRALTCRRKLPSEASQSDRQGGPAPGWGEGCGWKCVQGWDTARARQCMLVLRGHTSEHHGIAGGLAQQDLNTGGSWWGKPGHQQFHKCVCVHLEKQSKQLASVSKGSSIQFGERRKISEPLFVGGGGYTLAGPHSTLLSSLPSWLFVFYKALNNESLKMYTLYQGAQAEKASEDWHRDTKCA